MSIFFDRTLLIFRARPAPAQIFLNKICKNLSICTEEPRAGSFLKQTISLAKQIPNAACILWTINDKTFFDEIFFVTQLCLYINFSRAELRVFYWNKFNWRNKFNCKDISTYYLLFSTITSISRTLQGFWLEYAMKGLLTVTSVTMILLTVWLP